MILVPTLCAGMHREMLQRFGTLERTLMGYHAQRGNQGIRAVLVLPELVVA